MPDICEWLERHRAPLGRKPEGAAGERRAEAERLTRLMREHKGFSFGRLGDWEVGLLLNPGEAAVASGDSPVKISGTQPGGSPGLGPELFPRLRSALEKIGYLDFHERLWKDGRLPDQFEVKRAPESFRNPSRETSYILPMWVEHEFKAFCKGRRVLFCGAEAPLLENLLKKEAFRERARAVWPEDCRAFFLRPRDDGRDLGKNLDLIKADLRDEIQRHQIDTLFLSLGGGAKILCCELAEELGVCAMDFGVSLRSLTYSGSDGNLRTRSTHLVFLYRVPFGLYMDALEETYSDLSPAALLAKAHAQLLLEVQEKETGWSHAAWEYDFSPENRAAFKEAWRGYRERYRRLFKTSPEARKERKDFLHFCGAHKLTLEGRVFFGLFRAKGLARRWIGRQG